MKNIIENMLAALLVKMIKEWDCVLAILFVQVLVGVCVWWAMSLIF